MRGNKLASNGERVIKMSEREEREKAFYELQERYGSTLDAMRRVSGFYFHDAGPSGKTSLNPSVLPLKITMAERSTAIVKQRLELTLAELSTLPEAVPTYKQIGRA